MLFYSSCKYLHFEYVIEKQTELFRKCGTFFPRVSEIFFFSLIHENNNLVMRSPANSPIETRYRDVYTELTVVVFIWEIRICVLEARILGSMWENGGGRVCREWGIWYLPVRACDLAYFGT